MKRKKLHYTAEQAYDIAFKDLKLTFGEEGHFFTMVGWVSPTDGKITGPHIIAISGSEAIEVDRHGKFVNTFHKTCDCYIPWIEGTTK